MRIQAQTWVAGVQLTAQTQALAPSLGQHAVLHQP
jgi:hypothetical protein